MAGFVIRSFAYCDHFVGQVIFQLSDRGRNELCFSSLGENCIKLESKYFIH